MVTLGCFSEMYTNIKFQFLGSGALYLRFETCSKGINWKFCTYYMYKQKLLILPRLNDFMTCSACFNIQSEGSISQLQNTAERSNLCSPDTHVHKV